MTEINASAASARESARRSDGRFGTQPHSEPDPLAGSPSDVGPAAPVKVPRIPEDLAVGDVLVRRPPADRRTGERWASDGTATVEKIARRWVTARTERGLEFRFDRTDGALEGGGYAIGSVGSREFFEVNDDHDRAMAEIFEVFPPQSSVRSRLGGVSTESLRWIAAILRDDPGFER